MDHTDDAARHAGTLRRALEDGDVMLMWRIWTQVFPQYPALQTYAQAEIVLHRARTESESVAFKARAYSHAWLLDRDLPSGLPDALRPKAEQICPRIANAVGVSVNLGKTMRRLFPGLDAEVRGAMNEAVEELHADGVALDDRPRVHGLMFERREKTLKQLVGRLLPRA